MLEHITNSDIEAAIDQHTDSDDPQPVTADEVRDVLMSIQTSVDDFWVDLMNSIEGGPLDVIHEEGRTVILADRTGLQLNDELDMADVEEPIMRAVVRSLYRKVAERLCDHSWTVADPLVVSKPTSAEAGQQYVDAVINSLLQEGLSPGQAWAYYGVKIRGYSRNAWSKRCGYSDHSAVSEPLRKAMEKLNR